MSNFVYDNTEIFLNLEFGLDWISDAEMRKHLKERYYFEEMAYPNKYAMQLALQAKADEIADYFNELHKTTVYEYDPTINYKMRETANGSSSSTATGNNNSKEYPQDNPTNGKLIGSSDSTSSGSATAQSITERTGTIGLTTQALIAQQREVLLNLVDRYENEFKDYFILSL